jgi:hypothetical protein
VTGTSIVTPDSLLSTMKMLNSSDGEIRDTALISLASSDYSRCRNVVGYMLSRYYLDIVKKMNSKSTAVKWFSKSCDINRYRSYTFVGDEADFAKDFILKDSHGAVVYNDEPYRRELHCDDVGFLMHNHEFIKRIEGLRYDLSTANLVAARL